jgi:putative transposase
VTARANRKEKLLASPVAKELFIEVLAKYRRRSVCRILGFTVMDNHVHLLMQQDEDPGLSEAMKWILGVYTMNYNRVFKTWGHVWGGRYFSRPVNGFGDLVTALRYVDQNPVKACLVGCPRE